MSLARQLEEIQLISCSLLPGELFIFLEHCESWSEAVRLYNNEGLEAVETWVSRSLSQVLPPPCFQIGLETLNVWFEITFPRAAAAAFSGNGCGNGNGNGNGLYSTAHAHTKATVSVKGEDISRSEQEYWQQVVKEKMNEVGESEYPIYELVSSHLLPLLHEKAFASQELSSTTSPSPSPHSTSNPSSPSSSPPTHTPPQTQYHILLTSHHLLSPTKRRSLQHWSSSLSLTGFSKIGYPGIIYAYGSHQNIYEFASNVKSMQWLALRTRFIEPLPLPLPLAPIGKDSTTAAAGCLGSQWLEFQKIGEVMDEMRRIGREKYLIEMGIGSMGASKVG